MEKMEKLDGNKGYGKEHGWDALKRGAFGPRRLFIGEQMEKTQGIRNISALRSKAYSHWEAGSNDVATLDRIRRQMGEIKVIDGSELTFKTAFEILELVKVQGRD